VLRALAVLHAFSGERERLDRILRVARERGLHDPWVDLADGWADARDADRAARERALVKLGALAAARPDLLRGRFLLATAGEPVAVEVSAAAPLRLPLAALVGWIGGLTPRVCTLLDDPSAPAQTVTAVATDLAGNTTTASIEVRFNLTTAPDMTLEPAAG
jgi:hypothetical protein